MLDAISHKIRLYGYFRLLRSESVNYNGCGTFLCAESGLAGILSVLLVAKWSLQENSK